MKGKVLGGTLTFLTAMGLIVVELFVFTPVVAQMQADPDCDGRVTVSDPVVLINYIFGGQPLPYCVPPDAEPLFASFRAPGVVSKLPTVAEEFHLRRTRKGFLISDFDSLWLLVQNDSLSLPFAGDYISVNVSTPNDGFWYQYILEFRTGDLWAKGDSMFVMQKNGVYTTFKL